MDETMPDAAPLTQRFLASLADFMEQEHQPRGEGDISSQVKVAIATQVAGASSVQAADGAKVSEASSSHVSTASVDPLAD